MKYYGKDEMTVSGDDKILNPEPFIHGTSSVNDSYLGEYVDIGPRSEITESYVGDYTYFAGDNQCIYAEIGKFCSIASHVRINPVSHPMERVTTHHMTYRMKKYGLSEYNDEALFSWRKEHSVTIGNDVWIGHGAVIMPGVTIGNGAVIGAGSIVTHDVNPYEIAAGNPARVIRMRFPEEIWKKIEETAYWDWDREKLSENYTDFNDPLLFIEKHWRK